MRAGWIKTAGVRWKTTGEGHLVETNQTHQEYARQITGRNGNVPQSGFGGIIIMKVGVHHRPLVWLVRAALGLRSTLANSSHSALVGGQLKSDPILVLSLVAGGGGQHE